MKKAIALLMSLVWALCALNAFAEDDASFFGAFGSLEWSFSSGVGGWSTDMHIEEDGSFNGVFHDSEMGDCADEYPYGTVYICTFSGKLRLLEQVDGNTWKILVESLKIDDEPGQETIDEGVRYITDEVYGLTEGDEMLLYRPGTPTGIFSDEMLLWAHLMDMSDPAPVLENWFLASDKNCTGFVGYPGELLGMADPWTDMTAEELAGACGLRFGVPEGAENVVYRYLGSEGLAEMQFTWINGEFCARIRPADMFTDISGMYFTWDLVQPAEVGRCAGTVSQAQVSADEWTELCLWYDADQALMYSLSVNAGDVDGLDLTALAEQVYAAVR